jgi:hypothetical protein
VKTSNPTSLSWPGILAGLRACSGESVLIRDGKETEPASVVRSRPAAKGTELCLFPGERSATRLGLIRQLETLADATGRRFTKAARASIGNSYLLVESVGDETVDDELFAVIRTRRPVLAFNPGQQRGDTSALRSKRIKNR